MLDRLRQIVASLTNNPALLKLLRDDPKAFSQHLGLSDGEMQALNGAAEQVNRWGQHLVSLVRSSNTFAQWLPIPGVEEYSVAVGNRTVQGSGRGSGVPITAIVAILGLVATLSTVAVVAVSTDHNDA
jgi:hypothetical protein